MAITQTHKVSKMTQTHATIASMATTQTHNVSTMANKGMQQLQTMATTQQTQSVANKANKGMQTMQNGNNTPGFDSKHYPNNCFFQTSAYLYDSGPCVWQGPDFVECLTCSICLFGFVWVNDGQGNGSLCGA